MPQGKKGHADSAGVPCSIALFDQFGKADGNISIRNSVWSCNDLRTKSLELLQTRDTLPNGVSFALWSSWWMWRELFAKCCEMISEEVMSALGQYPNLLDNWRFVGLGPCFLPGNIKCNVCNPKFEQSDASRGIRGILQLWIWVFSTAIDARRVGHYSSSSSKCDKTTAARFFWGLVCSSLGSSFVSASSGLFLTFCRDFTSSETFPAAFIFSNLSWAFTTALWRILLQVSVFHIRNLWKTSYIKQGPCWDVNPRQTYNDTPNMLSDA